MRKVLFKNNGNVSETARTLYEWNLMDVGTRTRSTTYSYEACSTTYEPLKIKGS